MEEHELDRVKEEQYDSDDEIVLNEDVGISRIIDTFENVPLPPLPSSPIEDTFSPATDLPYDPDTSDEALEDPLPVGEGECIRCRMCDTSFLLYGWRAQHTFYL